MILVQVPRCIVNTPAAERLARRVVEENVARYRGNDVDAGWFRPSPLSGLMRVERSLGRRAEPNRTCLVCNAPTRTKCSHCLQAHYCSSHCQREHWPIHRHECQLPSITVERHVAIAVPDCYSFWAYQTWLHGQPTREGDPGLMLFPCLLYTSTSPRD